MAYELLVGRLPFGANGAQGMEARAIIEAKVLEYKDELQFPAELSKKARDFVRMCLRADQRKRPLTYKLLEQPFIVDFLPKKRRVQSERTIGSNRESIASKQRLTTIGDSTGDRFKVQSVTGPTAKPWDFQDFSEYKEKTSTPNGFSTNGLSPNGLNAQSNGTVLRNFHKFEWGNKAAEPVSNSPRPSLQQLNKRPSNDDKSPKTQSKGQEIANVVLKEVSPKLTQASVKSSWDRSSKSEVATSNGWPTYQEPNAEAPAFATDQTAAH